MSKSSRVSTEIFMFDDVNNNNINNNTIKTKKNTNYCSNK